MEDFIFINIPPRFSSLLDFQKSRLPCVFMTRQKKNSSYLIAVNFSKNKTDRYSTNQSCHEYALGTQLSNTSYLAQQEVTFAIKFNTRWIANFYTA